MTDRIKGLVVTLKGDMREDDAKPIVDAILCLRGVISVKTSVDKYEDAMNRSRVEHEMRARILDVLYPKAAP